MDIEIFYTEIGERIRNSRKKNGLDQDGLAKHLNLTRTSIVNIEKGRQKVSIYQLFLLSQILNVTVFELVPFLTETIENKWEHKIDLFISADASKKDSVLSFIKELS